MKLNVFNKIALLSGICALISYFCLTAASADQAPVFQHALEYQEPAPYKIVIHHEGKLAVENQRIVDELKEVELGKRIQSNISFSRIDHSKTETRHTGYDEDNLPRVEIRYPSSSGINRVIKTGPLDEAFVKKVLHSPVRHEIAEKLIDRKAAVWVLIPGNSNRKNEPVRERLEKVLSELEEELKVAPADGQYGEAAGEIYEDIDFAIIQLDRDTPEERMLINMLLGMEHDLADYDDKPIAFPIHGRGVVGHALIGNGINEWTLRSVGEFLTAPCSSCQIGVSAREMHLLISADWDGRVERLSNYDNAVRRYGASY